MTKVCITGTGGLIGSHLANYLLDKGFEVNGIDWKHCPTPQNIPKHKNYIHYTIDIRDRLLLKQALQGCEIVYHCAAYAAEIMSLFKPCYVTDVDVMGSLNVMTEAVEAGVKTFVFTSSNSVYGYQDKVPYSEDVEKFPKDIYAVGKLATEQMLEVMRQTHGMDYVIIRPHNVYGPNQCITDPYRNVLGIWMNRILHNKKPLVYGDGQQERAFTYIDDFTPVCAEAPFVDTALNTDFNIGSDENVTLEHAAQVVCEAMDFKEGYEFAPARPQEVKISYPSQEKAKRVLDYRAKISFKEGVNKMARWVKQQPLPKFNYWSDGSIEIWNKMPKVWKDKLL